MSNNHNPLLPHLATLQNVIDLTPDVRLFQIGDDPWGALPRNRDARCHYGKAFADWTPCQFTDGDGGDASYVDSASYAGTLAAYAAAIPKMNRDTPTLSRFYARLHTEFHNCWGGDCAASAATSVPGDNRLQATAPTTRLATVTVSQSRANGPIMPCLNR